MKTLRKLVLFFVLALFVATSSGCFGEFALTRAVYEWNDDVSSNNFVKTLVFWGLNIIPVYGIASFADLIIFNLIEFWTGSNPIAMADGEWEYQIVEYEGNLYELSATKNRLIVKGINGDEASTLCSFLYHEDSDRITAEAQGAEFVVAHVTK